MLTQDDLFVSLGRVCPACDSAEGLFADGQLCDGDGCWTLLHSACWERVDGCPTCQGLVPPWSLPPVTERGVRVLGGRPAQVCGYCHAGRLERSRPCPGCGIVLHDPCWLEADRCPCPGCTYVVSTRRRRRSRSPVRTQAAPERESLPAKLAISAMLPGTLCGLAYDLACVPVTPFDSRLAPLPYAVLGWLLWFLASWAAVGLYRRLRARS